LVGEQESHDLKYSFVTWGVSGWGNGGKQSGEVRALYARKSLGKWALEDDLKGRRPNLVGRERYHEPSNKKRKRAFV